VHWSNAADYGLSVVVFQRALAAVYLVAFVAAIGQNRALLGEQGMLPVARYVRAVPFRQSPSLFHLRSSDAWLLGAAWVGAAVSAALLLGAGDVVPRAASMALWAVPWALYLSIVNVGQVWYSFGWETLLVETGFLAIFLGPAGSAPTLVLVLLRWLLFRVEFGAGLIKLRGDDCWRDLTCLRYHHETQPMPGPFSWWFHHLPMPLHRVEVVANHVTQLVVPVLLFFPQPIASVAAGIMIVTQLWLMASGNFSWLNALTITIALPVLGDDVWTAILPLDAPAVAAPPAWHHGLVIVVTAVVGYLSVRPVRNLLSRRQLMNTSHHPLRLVNSYGAFGSITRVRYEVVLEGTDAEVLGPETVWREYGFRGKPGDPTRRPPQVAPYHLRLDWLMWFVALSPAYASGWFEPFVARLLVDDRATLRLLRDNPFPDRPPTYVRARLYEYRFTTRAERRETGAWWHRQAVGSFLRPLRRSDLAEVAPKPVDAGSG
jgi:hypothetical protein